MEAQSARLQFVDPRSIQLIVRLVALAALGIQLVASLSMVQSVGAVEPAPPHFERTWERVDRPVAELVESRSWLWGEDANTEVLQEPYAEAPGGMRQVQYFDKSRMEINNPAGDPDSPWYVTNGLLVVELMTGQMQVGDAEFIERLPSENNVAGDPGVPTSPTYQTFASLRDLPPLADGATITQRVDHDGNVTDDPALASFGVTAAEHVQVPGIDHRVASPFWDFMNSTGLIYDPEQGYIIDDLFLTAYYATGLPLTEAYWATVEVGGTPKDVLSQCFERRCMTYTPDNPPGWQVEAGNVGLHYRDWRTDPDFDINGMPPPADGGLVINEIKFWPEEGELQWVELYNPSDEDVDLAGMAITDGSGEDVSLLPVLLLPPGAYLLIYLGGDGADDLDFSDLRGAYYDAGAPPDMFDYEHDEVALYGPGERADSIVDFFAWSYDDVYQPLDLYAEAVAAGQWSDGDYFDATRRNGLDLAHPVGQGETVGRDALSTDTHSPTDWAELGGKDALGETPQFQNLHELAVNPPQPPPGGGGGGGGGDEDAEWTVMVFVDGRSNLYRAFLNEVNKMERAGSNEDVNIVVQFAWQSGPGDATGAIRWHLQQNSDMTRIPSPAFGLDPAEATNPGDPQALADFITWAETNYPAGKYAIVLAGHGQGWKGTMLNGEDSDFLKMSELSTGLSALSQKFEVVEFESCLMGQLEVGYQIAPYAEMMVASEEVMWTVPRWTQFFNDLKANPGWNAGQYADAKAQSNADAHRFAGSRTIRDFYTVASIDLTGLTGTLVPAVNAFATTLIDDVDDVNQRDLVADNSQVRIKHMAQELAEYFTDSNFKDLYHFADLVSMAPLKAAAPAGPLKTALAEGGPVIRWEDHGPNSADAHGLSIYFPHDLLLPDGTLRANDFGLEDWQRDLAKSPSSPVRFLAVDSFDDPKYDPEVNPDTHLYKLDASILLPRLRGEPHAMPDDPDFEFPNASTWDEFLHRYYKPVADACILIGGCVKEVTVEVGTDVPLSGRGSSDSDGPEDAMLGDGLHSAGGNDVPAHTTTAVEHYYWDFDTSIDNPAPKPNYVEGQLYEVCDIEDCDRDDVDELDDDRDAVGKTPIYPCVNPGTFVIRLMVWDEHHDHARERNEDRDHNEGRHWLHFNVHSDIVTIHCVTDEPPEDPFKRSSEDEVVPGEEFEYEIVVPANPGLDGPSTGSIFDNLPEWVEFGEIVACDGGECSYDELLHRVTMTNEALAPGDEMTLRFNVEVVVEPESEFPPEIVNCATVNDGLFVQQVCVTTTLIVESEPPAEDPTKAANKEQVTPGESLQYEIVVPASPQLGGQSDAGIFDQLPEWVDFVSIATCNAGQCGYDEVLHMVYMQNATLSPGETLILRFNVAVVQEAEEFPSEITNCADAFDGVAEHQLCVSTDLLVESGPPSTGTEVAIRPA